MTRILLIVALLSANSPIGLSLNDARPPVETAAFFSQTAFSLPVGWFYHPLPDGLKTFHHDSVVFIRKTAPALLGRGTRGLLGTPLDWVYRAGAHYAGWSDSDIDTFYAPFIETLVFQLFRVILPVVVSFWHLYDGSLLPSPEIIADAWESSFALSLKIGLASSLLNAFYYASPLTHADVIEVVRGTDLGMIVKRTKALDWKAFKKLFAWGFISGAAGWVVVEAAFALGYILCNTYNSDLSFVVFVAACAAIAGILFGTGAAFPLHAMFSKHSEERGGL